MHLGIDPLSVVFLCLLIPQVLAAAIAGVVRSPAFWVFVLALMLTLLAADAFTLILGFTLMSAASWLPVLRGDQRPATLYLGTAASSGLALIPALFLPPGAAAFLLLLFAAGAKAGLAPLHVWLPRAHPAPPPGVSAVMSGGMVNVALYVLIRTAFIVLGPAAQPWWGIALILAGAASVLIGGLRAAVEPEIKTLLACATVAQSGFIAVALGIALRAKACDDTALAALGLQAALFAAVAHALFKPLLYLGAGAVAAATGATSLDWLGGLMRGMPRLGMLMLAGAAGMAALPFGPGFPALALLLHAIIAAAVSADLLAGLGFAGLLAVVGLGAGLGFAAALRLIGVGFLGRPRTLRAAAAEEAPRRVLLAMALLAILCLLPALLPGLLLAALQPAIALLVPGAPRVPLNFQPLPLALLMLAAASLAFLLLRRFGARGTREVRAWTGGFGKPPVWLPFGDPKTQITGTGFAQPLRLALAGWLFTPAGEDPAEAWGLSVLLRAQPPFIRLAERLGRVPFRQRLITLFAVLVLALAALGLAEAGGV